IENEKTSVFKVLDNKHQTSADIGAILRHHKARSSSRHQAHRVIIRRGSNYNRNLPN
ncbi:hypothetical protein PILCRDRAFT_829642, partial [Piloderma croceum F 1598]